MKYLTKFSFAILALSLVFTACKKTAGDKAVTGAAGEVTKATGKATAYTIDNTNSQVLWVGSKPAGQHTGTIKISNGSLFTTNGQVSAGTFTMDMNSLTVTDLQGEYKGKLEGHLKGLAADSADDFFNVTKYPTATFSITNVEPNTTVPDANFSVTGNLRIKDKEKSITFPASIVTVGDKVIAVTPSFKINRTEWGINFKSNSVFDNLKDDFISDDIALNINIEAKL